MQIAACKSRMVLKADRAGHVLRGVAIGGSTSSNSITTNLPAKPGPQTSGAEFGQAELYSATLYDSDASASPIGLGQERASVPETQWCVFHRFSASFCMFLRSSDSLLAYKRAMLTYKRGQKERCSPVEIHPVCISFWWHSLTLWMETKSECTAVTRATGLTQRHLPLLRLGSNSITHRPLCSLNVSSLGMLVMLTWCFLAKATIAKNIVICSLSVATNAND
jgi:hypothetical protein